MIAGKSIFEMATLEQIGMIACGSGFLMALTIGTILTALMCRIGHRIGALDRPDGLLKCHERATPTLGGLPLLATLLISTLAVGTVVTLRDGGGLVGQWVQSVSLTGLIVSCVIITLLGVCDDLNQIMPRTKLFFQSIAALVVIGSGFVIQRCGFFGVFDVDLGILAVPFTLFWLIGSCNAYNFIDGMDGLASGIGLFSSLILGVLAFLCGDFADALIAFCLAGTLLAILMFNFKPAMIFLGDSGSQLIGLLLGALSIRIATQHGVFMLPAAGLILSIPIVDCFLSIIRRFSLLASPAQGDHRHIHHCLQREGLSVPEAAVTLWIATVLTGVMGIVFFYSWGIATGISALALVLIELYIGIRLGCLEVQGLMTRVGLVFHRQREDQKTATQTLLELELLWEHMKPLFEKTRLDRAILTLEGITTDGQPSCKIYRWARSESLMAEFLASRWTKRFSLGDDSQVATLQLESMEQLSRNERRIQWLLRQIRDNMRNSTRPDHPHPTPRAPQKANPEESPQYQKT